MNVVEYGKMNKQVIVLLHGGGLSWWNYREVAEQLQNDYHVVLPILDGHAGSKHNFTSIENNASELIEYIDKHMNGSVLLLGGVSLGGQIVVEALAQRSDICQYAVIESALVFPMKLTHSLVKPMLDSSFWLIKKKWFARLQFKSLKIKDELYEEYYRDTCLITKENMVSFLKANSNYQIKKALENTQAHVLIVAGEKEQKLMLKSAQALNKMISGSCMEIKKGLYHGEYSLNDAKEYAARIRKFIKKKETQK